MRSGAAAMAAPGRAQRSKVSRQLHAVMAAAVNRSMYATVWVAQEASAQEDLGLFMCRELWVHTRSVLAVRALRMWAQRALYSPRLVVLELPRRALAH